ncbi:MAG: DNA ligase D [Chitinophagaceae bacterium]
MLATLVSEPVEENGWVYEIKWDGYRAISYLHDGEVEIRSRNNKSFNQKFYPVTQALQQWKINTVLDGEIIVVNENSMPDFSDLQLWRSEADGQLAYYVFDVLWLDGVNVMQLPLVERHKLLQQIIPAGNDIIKLSEFFETTGKDFFRLAEELGLEGIFAKKKDSTYLPGSRSKQWLKIKTEKRQEFVIGGYTINENSSKPFSALLVGVYEKGKFHFVTPVGTGFNVAAQKDIIQKLKPYETAKCPFVEEPQYNKPSRFRPNPLKAKVVWVKPRLVAEVSYREITKDGAVRHPSFKGLREDKKPGEVVREYAENPQKIQQEEISAAKKLKEVKLISSPPKKERKNLLNPKEEAQTRTVNGHDLRFTNLSKIFWKKEGLTKRDMINYYSQVAPYMLPYLKDRPQTLNRHPHGIEDESFYQKNVKGKVPEWIETFPYYSETDHEEKEFLVCSNEASLLYIASLSCIEINPWSSRTSSPDNPNWCIIDLDPDKNPFEQVIQAAQVTKKVVDELEIPAYCKTSGSTGLHIYIPLGAKYSYHDSKELGRSIVKIVNSELPAFTSIERKTANRKGKIYLDFLQNRPQATVAAPYSLKPKPFAPVSMPLHCEEVKKGLQIKDFNLTNAIARLKQIGDLFKGVIGKGIVLKKVQKRMNAVFEQ